MFVNCYLFNLSDDIVAQWGRLLQQDFVNLCNDKGLKTIHIDMDKERQVAESEGAVLQDLTYYAPSTFSNLPSAAPFTVAPPLSAYQPQQTPMVMPPPPSDNKRSYENSFYGGYQVTFSWANREKQ